VKAISLCMVACVLTATSAAWAERAAYVSPDRLPGEGVSHLLSVGLYGSYARILDPARVADTANLGMFGVRTRLHLGRTVGYCLGLDANVGGSEGGVVYGATAYLAGAGVRWGKGNVVSLCGGAGIDGIGGSALPLAARFPAELSASSSLGPIRASLWVRPSWLVGAETRKHGASLSFMDEMELGLSLRFGRQRSYWTTTSAGGGVMVGATYRELMGTYAVGAFVGIDLTGGR